MARVIEVINAANKTYMQSESREELTKSAGVLATLLGNKSYETLISDTNRENAHFLLVKTQLKAYAVAYFCEGYDSGDLLALKGYAEEAADTCAALGFKKTAALCKSVLSCAQALDGVMFDAAEWQSRVRDDDGRCVARDAKECAEVSAVILKKIEALTALDFPQNIFTDGSAFPDVKAQAIGDLKELRALAEELRLSLEEAYAKEVLRTGAEDITKSLAAKNYVYYPDVNVDRLAPALVLFTPYPDEAELFAYTHACGASVVRLQALAFEGLDEDGLTAVFDHFVRQSGDLVIYGMPHYRGANKDAFYRAAMRFGKEGRRAYIVADDGTRSVYDEAVKAAGGGLTALDIGFLYLSLPDFAQTVDTLKELKMISDSSVDEEFVKRGMPFAGFAGLNEAVKAFRAGADWKKIAEERSQDNFNAASKYMLKLSRQALFIDGGWGNYHDDIVVNKSKSFDYDDVRVANPDNIRRIMQGNFTLFQKCGLISTYCMLCGASADDWKGFSPEVKSERLTEATKLVMRALGIDIVPKVEVLEELEEGGAGGLCCLGGKLIKYKASAVEDFEWTARAICHESFHAFQHYAVNNGWQDWYETELHVTRGRIEQWDYNNRNYRAMSKGRVVYLIQIVESDARAFEDDCFGKGCGSAQILNLIDLD